jgi:hypothetical protein
MTLRIAPELHEKLSSRSAESGRPMTTEALRLIDKGLMLDQSLGERAESGFDIMVAYSLNGASGVIDMLVKKLGVEPMALRASIAQAEYGTKFDALPPERQHEILYGLKP